MSYASECMRGRTMTDRQLGTLETHRVLLETLLIGSRLRDLKRCNMQNVAISFAGSKPRYVLSVAMVCRFEQLVREQGLELSDALDQLIADRFIEQMANTATADELPTPTVIH